MTKKTKTPARRGVTPKRGLKETILVKDSRTPIVEEDLAKLVLRTLHENGFDWIQSVALSRQRLRIPNWQLLRTTGYPPSPQDSMRAMNCPAVQELRKEYALLDPRASPPESN
jgi:hypothetical protein